VLMTTNAELLKHPRIAPVVTSLPDRPEVGVWTDDFSTILRVIK
jgi:hypothetical protein